MESMESKQRRMVNQGGKSVCERETDKQDKNDKKAEIEKQVVHV